MARSGQKKKEAGAGRFYDRIADVHNVALKINGYRGSVAKYLRSLGLELSETSNVLDAGSGTGIVTLGFRDSGLPFKRTVALDLSHRSLGVAAVEYRKDKRSNGRVIDPVQGNVLQLPFADETFDLVLSCGVLEYVPLDDGLQEMARVLVPGGKLVFIPVKPSIVGSVLEFLYKFKIHPIENVRRISQQYFNLVGNHEFPLNEPISWSKTIFLLEKK
ncbi:MAG TPA: class I SAM-dependent methyltransferase [Pyrinomonadaceae bacterium]|nr:class I SAM-dependent methyltransferase [Pyrinomonadaceae bacterium]HMP64340.1 class I SAM-dependent methyltransferase [Pyrinomonadaceae bacterium]